MKDIPMKIQIKIFMGSLSLAPLLTYPPKRAGKFHFLVIVKVFFCLSTSEGEHLGRKQVGSKQGSLKMSSIYSQQNRLREPRAGTADVRGWARQ